MKRALPLLRIPFSTTTTPTLTPEDLTSIHTLTHCLIDSNRHDVAIRLLTTSLLPSPSLPLSSLPIPILIHHLTSLPSLSPSISLLTSLRHTPSSSTSLPHISSLLLSSLLSKRRYNDSYKLVSWFLKGEDSPCRPSEEMYGVALRGFCGEGRGKETMKVVREMVRDGLAVGEEERGLVRMCLLREARIDAAEEVDAAVVAGDVDVLHRIVREWED